MKEKTKRILVVVVKCCHRAKDLFAPGALISFYFSRGEGGGALIQALPLNNI